MAAIVVDFEPGETDEVHSVTAALKYSETAELLARVEAALQVAGAGDVRPGESLIVPMVLDLRGVQLNEFGRHDITITVDGGPAHLLTFWLDQDPDAGAA